MLPDGKTEFRPEKIIACDASYDTMDDVPPEVRSDRRYAKYSEYSIQGTVDAVGKEFGGIDILIHSIAFSREITKTRSIQAEKPTTKRWVLAPIRSSVSFVRQLLFWLTDGGHRSLA